MELLMALVGQPGELVSKQELMALVWPRTTVVEANLRVNIAAVREAIGDGRDGARYIANTPGRGYRFVAPVTVGHAPTPAAAVGTTGIATHNLPARLTRLIGREEVVRRLVERLKNHRFLTVAGPGGIGKTAVALEVAEAVSPSYRDGVWLVDLALLSDARLVPAALASTLKLQIRSDDPLPDLAAALRDKQMLLVLDNCEHVIDAAAAMAASVLSVGREVRILATSREPLRVEGELVRRLPPLKSPPPGVRLSASQALDYPAVQLFVERTAASVTGFEFGDDDATSAGEICRQLDGVALAIELAAARVITLGVCGLATQLDNRLKLLTRGRRASLPRHQTIGAVIDWSYRLLTGAEQATLRRLAVFAGGFTLESACKVIGAVGPSEADVAENVVELVAKSLIVTDPPGAQPRFRLLETTRAYALVELATSGERDEISRRHAEYYRDLLEAARKGRAPANSSPNTLLAEIDNIRAALTWAFSPGGNASMGVALAAASAPVWLGLSLLTECRDWMRKAIGVLDADSRTTRIEMVLQSALASSQIFTRSMGGGAFAAWTKAADLAANLQDAGNELNALLILWAFQIRRPDYREALALALRFEAVAARAADPEQMAIADWLVGVSRHHLGQHAAARPHMARGARKDPDAVRRARIGQLGGDRRAAVLSVHSNLLWVQGYPSQALEAASTAIEEARRLDSGLGVATRLFWGGYTMFLAGVDTNATEEIAAELVERAERSSLDSLIAQGLCLLGLCRLWAEDLEIGQKLLSEGIEGLVRTGYEVFCPIFGAELARSRAAGGRVEQALADIARIELDERHADHWNVPEIRRIKGELFLRRGDPAAAEAQFMSALDLAHRQGALSWELRAASSLARLCRQQDRVNEARDIVGRVYDRFTEGFETADLRTAKQLLDHLG